MDYVARWYSPTSGRFTQPDTIVPNPYSPQSLNRYAYVLNNPVNLVDPDGNCARLIDSLQCVTSTTGTGMQVTSQVSDTITVPEVDVWLGEGDDHDADFIVRLTGLLNYTEDEILNDWGEVRKKYTALDAMKAIIDQAASIFDEDWDGFLDSLSFVFMGVATHGTTGMMSGWLNDDNLRYGFGDSGFHPMFQDESNQVRHLWAAIATSALPGNPYGYLPSILVGNSGSILHEYLQPILTGDIGSNQDYYLSEQGFFIGGAITFGLVEPNQLSALIETVVGGSRPNSDPDWPYNQP